MVSSVISADVAGRLWDNGAQVTQIQSMHDAVPRNKIADWSMV